MASEGWYPVVSLAQERGIAVAEHGKAVHGQGCVRRDEGAEGEGEGVWYPKLCGPKMARSDCPGEFVFSHDGHFGSGGGGSSCGGQPF